MALEKHECKKIDDWEDWEKTIPRLPECSHAAREMQTNGNCQATRSFDDPYDSHNQLKMPWNIQNCVFGKDRNSSTNYNVFRCERGNL